MPVRYQFIIDGTLSERALAAFPELTASDRAPGDVTTLYGPVGDPVAMRSIMARIDSLGLTLLEMRQMPD
ncbi:hypothetical protein [Nocardia bovistercoris]|uniref:Uncharacterized protein n=1 Tax=Nocardia bovistercoris TaxID=2785916 RepID=A0A931N061_9NOCA|nr:hypothetical protein [Nocardia bovistercoris]MBH0776900.1 hypothetical protein [Nocardia bovistercoris]